MRKTVIVLLMVVLCFAFFIMTSNRKPFVNEPIKNIDVASELQKDSNRIDQNYPEDPKELVALHNKIMTYLYSQKMQKELVEFYTDTVRKLYHKDLLESNSKEDQMNMILIEKEEYTIKMVKLIDSKIEDITYFENGEKAKVRVTYHLNIVDINRLYDLENTPEGWKIMSWEDTKIQKTKVEE